MTLAEAQAVIANMDKASTEPFTKEERAALMVIGAAWLRREITRSQFSELLGFDPDEPPS